MLIITLQNTINCFLKVKMSFVITAAFLVCLILLAWFSAQRPASAIAIGAFFFPFESYYQLGVTITSNELLILSLFSGLVARFIRDNTGFRRILKVCLLFLPFCVWMFISSASAASPSNALKDIVRWLSFFAVFAIAALSMEWRNDLRKLAVSLVAASVPASLYGVFQSVMGPPSAAFELEPHSRIDSLFCLTTGWHVRAHSFFNQANSFACYLVIILPLCIFLFARNRTALGKAAAAGALVLNLIALMLTFSRASWPLALASIAALLYFGRAKREAKSSGRRPLILALLAVLALASVAAVLFRGADFASLTSMDSGVQRVHLYRAGLLMIAKRPVLGYGPGNYHLAMAHVQMGRAEERLKRAHLHNLYLQIALESGLVGLCAFIFFAVSGIWLLIRSCRSAQAAEARYLAGAVCVSVCAFFAYNMIDIFRYHGVHLIAGALMGAGVAMQRWQGLKEGQHARDAHGFLAIVPGDAG